MRRSLSGDHVVALPGHYLKYGSANVGRQGRIMRRASVLVPGIAPSVVACGKRLHVTKAALPILNANHIADDLVRTAITRLGHIWMHREFDLQEAQGHWRVAQFEDALFDYLQERGALDFFKILPNMRSLIRAYDDADEATHGDCTFENMVWNNGQLAFIDWMPYRRPYLPAHRDVDYGKLVQSLLGWHGLNYAAKDDKRWDIVRWILQDRPMAAFWACIHYERIKARTDEPLTRIICDGSISILFKLAKEL